MSTHRVAAPSGLTVATLDLLFRAQEELRLPPMAATTLRGALGNGLRWASCTTGAPECTGCPRRSACTYGSTWEPRRPELGRFSTPSPPYIVDARWGYDHHLLEAGETFGMRLTLFGVARGYVPAFLTAAIHAGAAGFGPPEARVPAQLVEAWQDGMTDEPTLVYHHERGLYAWSPDSAILLSPQWIEGAPTRVRLSFDTPLELTEQLPNKRRVLVRDLTARIFTERLIERFAVLSLAYEYAAAELPRDELLELADYAVLVEDQRELVTERRYTNRSERKLDFGGWTGHATFANVHPALASFWQLAEWIHLGRNAVFGMGAVRVENT